MQSPLSLTRVAIFAATLLFSSFAQVIPASADAAAPATEADRFIWLLDAESLGGYSDADGASEGDFSTSNRWLVSGALKLNERDQLIGLYNGSFRQSHLFIRQEEGGQSSNQLMTHNLSGAVKKYFGDTFIFKPVVFYNLTYVKDAANEDLGDGLYDFEDFGGGFENTHFLGSESDNRLLVYAFNAFQREYPNYQSLASLAGALGPAEENEKDFTGYKIDLRYQVPWWFQTKAEVGGTVLFKDYTDKLTINSNGVRQSGNRFDTYWESYGTVTKNVNDRISADFTMTVRRNSSNLDFYDTRGTLALTDDRFFGGYYDYWAYEARPSVSVLGPKFAESAKPSAVRITYAYENTMYDGRPAQSTLGALLGDDQEDDTHRLDALVSVPLDRNWTFLLSGSYETQSSNQKFEQTYRYNYDTWSILSGVRFEL